MLIGRNIVNAVKADFEAKTLEDVVSKFFTESGFNELSMNEQVAQKSASKISAGIANVGGAK
jgi:hypothetical protein